MYVCLCNSFNDKAVKDAIAVFAPDRVIERKEIRLLHKICSDGAPPVCGKCLTTQFLDHVNAHNEEILKKQGANGVQISIPANDIAPPAGAGGCDNCQCGKGGPRCV